MTQDDRELVVARAERHYLLQDHADDILKAAVHGNEVVIFGSGNRVLAKYGFDVTPNRLKVWPLQNKPLSTPVAPFPN